MAIGPIGHGKTFAVLCSILKNCNENDHSTQSILFCATHDSAWEAYSNALLLLNLGRLNTSIGFVSKDCITKFDSFQVLIGTVSDIIDKVEEENLFSSIKEIYFDDGDAYVTSYRMKKFVYRMHRTTRAIFVSNSFNQNAKNVMKSCGRKLDFYDSSVNKIDVLQHVFIKYDETATKYHILKNICEQVKLLFGVSGQLLIFCAVGVSICVYIYIESAFLAYMLR